MAPFSIQIQANVLVQSQGRV